LLLEPLQLRDGVLVEDLLAPQPVQLGAQLLVLGREAVVADDAVPGVAERGGHPARAVADRRDDVDGTLAGGGDGGDPARLEGDDGVGEQCDDGQEVARTPASAPSRAEVMAMTPRASRVMRVMASSVTTSRM